ncbi:MAG: thioredoxin-dependent thiol peroxidase [Cyanobacteria bacterium P01_D01_bin.123]
MSLTVGDLAPDFTLPSDRGNPITLSDYRGRRVVLYFYPRDNTPGCTQEACGFRDARAAFNDLDTLILGVSTDSVASHQKFVAKHKLSFPLLADEDAAVSTAYGVYGLKKFMGREYLGIKRSTFVIAADGRIEKIYSKVKAASHAQTVLQDMDVVRESS